MLSISIFGILLRKSFEQICSMVFLNEIQKTAKLSKNNENHTPAGSEPGPTPISGPYLFKSQPTSPFPMFLRGFGRRWGSLKG